MVIELLPYKISLTIQEGKGGTKGGPSCPYHAEDISNNGDSAKKKEG